MDDESGVGSVVCIKHRDFGESNINTNYLSAVIEDDLDLEDKWGDNLGGKLEGKLREALEDDTKQRWLYSMK